MRRFLTGSTIAVVLCFALPAAATADGLPAPDAVPPSEGIAAPGAAVRYISPPAVEGSVIARVSQDGGELLDSRAIEDRLTIPTVAYDGSPAGLSADGRTVVLIRPRVLFPQRRTKLEILDTSQLRTTNRIELRGDFSFDAISPDGSRIYLVEYPNPTDPTQYLVRAYDIDADRLLPEPILDPEEDPGEMRGYPLTRATSPDGRWAYTLYDGGGEHPFIHALDTVEGRTVCIDVDQLAGHPALRDFAPGPIDRFELISGDDGAELSVVDRGTPVAIVDTETFEVTDADAEGASVPWLAVAAAIAVIAAMVLTMGPRRRHVRAE